MDTGIVPELFRTPGGALYFKQPGVGLLSSTQARMETTLSSFLSQFHDDSSYGQYVEDPARVRLTQGEMTAKFAAQLSSMGFGPRRVWDEEAPSFMNLIKEESNGQFLDHGSVSFLFWGISRLFAREFLLQRIGFTYTEVDFNFLSEKTIRFVCRPDFGGDIPSFERRVDLSMRSYYAGSSSFSSEVEAPAVMTATYRTWRHFLEVSGAKTADKELREVAIRVHHILRLMEPSIFGDYRIDEGALTTVFRKV